MLPRAANPGSWRAHARAFADDAVLYRGTPPEEEARIGEIARLQTVRIVRPLLVVAAVLGLCWWPFDLLLYPREVVRAFALWRAAVVLYCGVYYVTCDRWELMRRYPAAYATACGALITFVVAATLGSLGPVLKPWFASLLLTPVMSFPFLVTPRARLLGTSVVALAGLVGFFAFSADRPATGDLGTAVGLMAFSVAVSSFAGHAIYHLYRVGLLQREELTRRTHELEALSGHLSDTVEARTAELRALAVYVEELRETERRAVARDLHDELGQLLTGIRIELDLAERIRTRGGDVGTHHANLQALVDATLASTRGILAHLRPRILDDFGLVAALDWLAADTRTRSGLDVRFRAEPEDFAVPDETATGLFRIVQESVTNALRHAGARTIAIAVRRGARGIEATIADDGRGLAPPSERRAFAGGLLGMRERAAALGGALEITAPAEGGTLVAVRLPLAPESP